jgi:protein-L-isoaspartate(D-aspartate) O-methyltransferase
MSQTEEEQNFASTAQLRERLVQQLISGGAIRSSQIRDAFADVPRENFLPPEVPLEKVYSDDAIVVKWNEARIATSSSTQPYLMADMLEALDVQPGMKVLEIGAGVGYNAAIIAHVLGDGALLTSVDLDPAMAEIARQNLIRLGSPYDRTNVIAGDGSLGYPPNAPYDRIIVTVQQWEISPDWVAQLKVGGILILPLSISIHVWGGLIPALRKEADGTLRAVAASHGGFMPMRGQMAHPTARQDEVDGPPQPSLVPLKLEASELAPNLPVAGKFPFLVSTQGLPERVAELLATEQDKLNYWPNGNFQLGIEELPPSNLKWNELNQEQRRASRAYYGYTSLLAVALEDQLATLVVTVLPPSASETESESGEQGRTIIREAYGLVVALLLPASDSFDLALLIGVLARGWRVGLNSELQPAGNTDQNTALAKLQEIWENWQHLKRPLPSDYRPQAYPANRPAPGPGFIIHRKYYNLLIPLEMS